jgi:chemotaxis regulatin CheY-phosphate phosphatase CheZ
MLNIPELFLEDLIRYRAEQGNKIDAFDIPEIIKIFMSIFKAQINKDSHVDLYNELLEIEKKFTALFEAADKFKPYKIRIEVVKHPEHATNTILDAVEQIQIIASGLEDQQASNNINNLSILIMESCNFQDLTGQRIRKVQNIFDHIEKLILEIVKNLDIPKKEEDLKEENALTERERKQGKHLLNGPQVQTEAPDQKSIDDIFNS